MFRAFRRIGQPMRLICFWILRECNAKKQHRDACVTVLLPHQTLNNLKNSIRLGLRSRAALVARRAMELVEFLGRRDHAVRRDREVYAVRGYRTPRE